MINAPKQGAWFANPVIRVALQEAISCSLSGVLAFANSAVGTVGAGGRR
jgi:hypothetical protein